MLYFQRYDLIEMYSYFYLLCLPTVTNQCHRVTLIIPPFSIAWNAVERALLCRQEWEWNVNRKPVIEPSYVIPFLNANSNSWNHVYCLILL